MTIRKIEFYISFSSINTFKRIYLKTMSPKETYIQRKVLNFDKINQYRYFTGLRNEVNVLITETSHHVHG